MPGPSLITNNMRPDSFYGTQGVGEIVRANNGVLVILNLAAGLGVSGALGSGEFNDLFISLQNFEYPKSDVELIQVPFLNTRVNLAGMTNHQPISVGYKAIVGKQIARVLHAWKEKIYDPSTGHIGYASEYKFNGWAAATDGKGNIAYYDGGTPYYFAMYGMILSSLDFGSADMDGGSDYVRIQCEFAVDNWALVTSKPTQTWPAATAPS